MTAGQATLITPTDGLIVYVTSTDSTFTTVGLWEYEAGSWKKLVTEPEILSSTVTLTPSQMSNLHITPIDIVPAQGANTVIDVVGYVADLQFNSIAYSGGGSGIDIGNSSSTVQANIDNGFLTQSTQSTFKEMSSSSTILKNTALTLMNNGAAFTSGDSNVVVSVYYRVVNL